MKVIQNPNERETAVEMIKNNNCYHQYLKLNPVTKDRVCVYCGKTVYKGTNQ